MEHEVYVPFPVGTVRQALTEPERVARCVPGVQLDAEAVPRRPEGRLRLRIGSSTITYRGSLTVAAEDEPGDDAAAVVAVEAKGVESRGDGAAVLSLTLRLFPATEPGPGTRLVCSGSVHSDGRLAEATDQSAAAAGRRLLDRFAENLTEDLRQRPVAEASGEDGHAGPVPDAEMLPPSLDPLRDEDALGTADIGEVAGAEDLDAVEDLDADDAADAFHAAHEARPEHAYGHDEDGIAPAEAAHARRTMIGRSAEEVDHAPPRGRYAPVPAPEPHAASMTLRWAAPAAAVVLASAVVVGRVLRRRR
ncbi:SRPBCC domain-containing protein [Streptomyces sioyaensis]|uniref:SRPBCC domain-containing protein n=1 Tax=Streptomyces sioyaensis TaxID=67364 RepID=UPI0037B40829